MPPTQQTKLFVDIGLFFRKIYLKDADIAHIVLRILAFKPSKLLVFLIIFFQKNNTIPYKVRMI
jgi:hypothetical protein